MLSETSDLLDVAVVLVGLNAREYIRGCLNSLVAAEWRERTYEIIYVDNGSSDGTLDMLKEFPFVKVIINAKNLGFCRAANQGAEIANAKYLFFLNDDTIILEDAVARLVDFMETDPSVGIVGSRLFYSDMTEQWSGRRFPSLANAVLGRCTFLTRLFPNAPPVVKYLCKNELSGDKPFQVDWVSAAAMMIRRTSFDAIRGFAEDYYYWHEPVFCDRLSRLGQKTYLHPLSKIIHFEGKGSGPRPFPVRKFHILNFHEGAYRCYCEHYGLSRWHPGRWFACTALKTRAFLLLSVAWLSDRWRRLAKPDEIQSHIAPIPPQLPTKGT